MIKQKLTFQEKAILVGTGGFIVAGYVLHRRRINTLITAWQQVRDDTMWSSFDSGVQYGISLAQRLAAGEVVSTEDVKAAAKEAGYAFRAFDKAA